MIISLEAGRPMPVNEAEKILEILEVGRRPNSFLGKKRYAPNVSDFLYICTYMHMLGSSH
jgi:hypothetical protein